MSEQLQRIAMIGSPGGGKSTLATAIAAATGLPVIQLDREYWAPGWVEPATDEWRTRNAVIVAGERWVIDGNYGSSLAARLDRADLIVWVDLPTRICLAGAIRRRWRYRHGTRPDMSEGCPERLDAEWLKFLWYIATFRRRQRPGMVAALGGSRLPVVQVKTAEERAALHRAAGTGHGIARLASSRIERP